MMLLFYILMVIGLVGFFVAGVMIGDSEAGEEGAGPLVLILVSTMLFGASLVTVLMTIEHNQYKQGQIDALTGDVKYELKVQPDSTRIWVEKAGNK